MTREVMDLVKAMGTGDWEESVLETMCALALDSLRKRLRPGVEEADCGGALPVAAAWMALAMLEECGGDVESFSAGGLSIRRKSGRRLWHQAQQLMAPYCHEQGFAFRGVPG